MTGYLTDYKGKTWRLPVLLSWDVTHGMGEPCDAFEISFIYSPDMADMLYGATRFRGEHEGQTVFFGVVDEYETASDEAGLTATVRGRSLEALLLDNQCQAAEYAGAGLDYILRQHVYPWGVKNVRTKPMPRASAITVSTGDSQWSVLKEYCAFAGGVSPRFSKEGALLLDGSLGDRLYIGAKTAISSAVFRDNRYGVISEALVKNKAGGTSQTVKNPAYAGRGASCRRVISVPRRTSCDLMRYTGQYQITKSQSGKRVCQITMPKLFAAFAGDVVVMDYAPLGIKGNFTVYESHCWADESSAGTELTLEAM